MRGVSRFDAGFDIALGSAQYSRAHRTLWHDPSTQEPLDMVPAKGVSAVTALEEVVEQAKSHGACLSRVEESQKLIGAECLWRASASACRITDHQIVGPKREAALV